MEWKEHNKKYKISSHMFPVGKCKMVIIYYMERKSSKTVYRFVLTYRGGEK